MLSALCILYRLSLVTTLCGGHCIIIQFYSERDNEEKRFEGI